MQKATQSPSVLRRSSWIQFRFGFPLVAMGGSVVGRGRRTASRIRCAMGTSSGAAQPLTAVEIIEVAPRDGLQNEKQLLDDRGQARADRARLRGRRAADRGDVVRAPGARAADGRRRGGRRRADAPRRRRLRGPRAERARLRPGPRRRDPRGEHRRDHDRDLQPAQPGDVGRRGRRGRVEDPRARRGRRHPGDRDDLGGLRLPVRGRGAARHPHPGGDAGRGDRRGRDRPRRHDRRRGAERRRGADRRRARDRGVAARCGRTSTTRATRPSRTWSPRFAPA